MNIDENIAWLCSIALYEFSIRHKDDLSGMAEDAKKISVAIEEMILSRVFRKEN